MTYDGMSWIRWTGYKCASWMPATFYRWFWSQEPGSKVHLSPEEHLSYLRSCVAKVQPHEREAGRFNTEESVQLWFRTSREAFKHGFDGIVADTSRLLADWGFRVEDIRKDLPVLLWYGTFDGLAPPALGKHIAQRLGDNALLVIKDETHGSMFANQPQEYLRELVNILNEQQRTTT